MYLLVVRSCPSKGQCYNDVYNIEYDPELDWSLNRYEWMDEDPWWDEEISEQEEDNYQQEENDQEEVTSSSVLDDDEYTIRGNSSEADQDQALYDDSSNS